jgi:dephospho-CoA kinase
MSNIVGITGGIGSGKTTITNMFIDKGIAVIDADIVAREVVAPNSDALADIVNYFGKESLQSDGCLNRAYLRAVIFDSPEQKSWLESLLHPIIRQQIIEQLQHALAISPYVILSSPLLLETDQHSLVDFIIAIDITEQSQIQRAAHRDTNSTEQIKKIIATQISTDERCKQADLIINNDGAIDQLHLQIDKIHQSLMDRFSKL